jgi:two-component system sensor histidine kinase BaeS
VIRRDRPGRRTSLALRISLLTTGVAVIAALIAGGLGVGLIERDNVSSASSTLRNLADSAQGAISSSGSQTLAERADLRALKVQFALVTKAGRVTGGTALARDALTPADITVLLAGRSISSTRTVDGTRLFIEGRPTATGGFVLAQRRSDALASSAQAVRRLVLALLVGVGVAILLGLLVAVRLARPLRRTAAGAHALAAGQRDVAVPTDGPAEVAEVADAVNVLSAALSQSEGRQREFLLSVSHDLRTPLAAIAGFAESLADGVIEPGDVPRVGEVLRSESARLNRLVSDLLDLARLDAQDFRLDIGRVDVGEVVRSAASVWSVRGQAAGVRFGLEAPPFPLVARTDAARLRQVLDGLFDNALRVTPAGALIVLAARPERAGDGRPVIAIDVRDGGPGLRDDDLAVAFEPGELHRRYRGVRPVGTGFGLAIGQRLVTRLGGTIEAGRAMEGGARFTVRLPGSLA